MISTATQATASENVYLGVYDLKGIEELEPRWPDFSAASRLRALSYLEPVEEERTHNTTTIELDEYRALNLDTTRDVDDKPVEIALGDDGTEPAYENTELNNELGRSLIDEFAVDGTSIIFNAFVPQEEITEDDDGNNPELTELGVVTEDDRLLNHSLFNSVEKTPQRAIQAQVTLTFDTNNE